MVHCRFRGKAHNRELCSWFRWFILLARAYDWLAGWLVGWVVGWLAACQENVHDFLRGYFTPARFNCCRSLGFDKFGFLRCRRRTALWSRVRGMLNVEGCDVQSRVATYIVSSFLSMSNPITKFSPSGQNSTNYCRRSAPTQSKIYVDEWPTRVFNASTNNKRIKIIEWKCKTCGTNMSYEYWNQRLFFCGWCHIVATFTDADASSNAWMAFACSIQLQTMWRPTTEFRWACQNIMPGSGQLCRTHPTNGRCKITCESGQTHFSKRFWQHHAQLTSAHCTHCMHERKHFRNRPFQKCRTCKAHRLKPSRE